MIEMFAALAAGGAIALAFAGALRARQLQPSDHRVRTLVEKPATMHRGITWEDVRRGGTPRLPLLRGLLLESEWAKRTERTIEQAGLKLRVSEYLIGRVGMAAVTAAVVMLLGRNTVSVVLGLALGGLAFFLPNVWLSVLRQRRINQIAKQLPEAATMMSQGLKAGFAFQHTMDMVAREMQAPISEEFAKTMVDLNVGSTIEEALLAMLERADSEEMNMVVTAVLIQRTSGGNLAEILETVGETMREKERLIGEVRTMTSQQRFSGMVLAAWPAVLLGVFSLMNWDHMSILFTTTAGLILLTMGGIGQILGFLTIRKILDIDI
jgi:tight adherence protein B